MEDVHPRPRGRRGAGVHAGDCALGRAAVGESFRLSGAALTLRGYAEQMAAWFGQPARLEYLPLGTVARDGF